MLSMLWTYDTLTISMLFGHFHFVFFLKTLFGLEFRSQLLYTCVFWRMRLPCIVEKPTVREIIENVGASILYMFKLTPMSLYMSKGNTFTYKRMCHFSHNDIDNVMNLWEVDYWALVPYLVTFSSVLTTYRMPSWGKCKNFMFVIIFTGISSIGKHNFSENIFFKASLKHMCKLPTGWELYHLWVSKA